MIFFKWIFSEIKNSKSFTFIFLFNMSLGLCGFIALDGFKNSVSTTIRDKSKVILGADLSLNARRPITDAERALVLKLAPQSQTSQNIEIFSMIATKDGRSLLSQIKAIETGFPFYGTIELEQGQQDLKSSQVWVYPEVLAQMDLKLGDPLFIGDKSFKISGVITNDPAAGFSTSMAPRVYISYADVKDTGLLKVGSLARYAQVYKMPELSAQKLQALRDEVFQSAKDADLQVYTHQTSSEQLGRLLGYLNDFLGLTSLVALFLSSIGTGFLAYSFLRKKTKEMAILISLGLPHSQTFLFVLLHIMLLGLISAIISLLLAVGLLPLLNSLTRGLIPFDIDFYVDLRTVAFALLIGIGGGVLIVLPFLLQMRGLRPSLLFSQQRESHSRWDIWSLLGFVPVFSAFFILSIFQTQSLRIGLIFYGAFMGSGLVFFALSYTFLWVLSKFKISRPLTVSWALRDLTRHRLVSVTAFLTLGLGIMMMNVIPQIQASLQEELKAPEHSKLPSLFLFDIQQEQVDPLKKILEKNQVTLNDLSPLVRARLLTVNGESFDKGQGSGNSKKSYKESQEAEFRNRGFNLSYREGLSSSETLVSGELFSKNTSDLAQISVETGFADRLHLKIGDILVFDIQSIPVSGKIVNLRKVKWTSFQPNFFIIFQPGFLNDAPKTFLATLPRLPLNKKMDLQNQIVRELTNVSLIDVTRTMERISQIIRQMSWALQFMSLLNVLVGLVVLYSLANHQARERQTDIGLLKALGASFSNIQNSFLLQFLFIALASGFIGVLGSFAVSFLFSKLLFENVWIFDGQSPVIILGVTLLSSAFVTLLAIRQSLSTSPQKLLSES